MNEQTVGGLRRRLRMPGSCHVWILVEGIEVESYKSRIKEALRSLHRDQPITYAASWTTDGTHKWQIVRIGREEATT